MAQFHFIETEIRRISLKMKLNLFVLLQEKLVNTMKTVEVAEYGKCQALVLSILDKFQFKGTVMRKSMWALNAHFSEETTMLPFIWV